MINNESGLSGSWLSVSNERVRRHSAELATVACGRQRHCHEADFPGPPAFQVNSNLDQEKFFGLRWRARTSGSGRGSLGGASSGGNPPGGGGAAAGDCDDDDDDDDDDELAFSSSPPPPDAGPSSLVSAAGESSP